MNNKFSQLSDKSGENNEIEHYSHLKQKNADNKKTHKTQIITYPKYEKNKKLIVLDINGILCYKFYSIDNKKNIVIDSLTKSGYIINKDFFNVRNFLILLRPGVFEFLEFCYKYADIGFYSSTMPLNASSILNVILSTEQKEKTKFFWYRDKTVPNIDVNKNIEESNNLNKKENKNYSTVKLLKNIFDDGKINPWHMYNEKNTLLIDDSPSKTSLNDPNNVLILDSFILDDEIKNIREEYIFDKKNIDEKNINCMKNAVDKIKSKFIILDSLKSMSSIEEEIENIFL